MIIRHSKKLLFISAVFGLLIFTIIYFAFVRFLTNAFYAYMAGFIISIVCCFGPFIKEYYEYRTSYLEIDENTVSIIKLFDKVVIPINRLSDYKIKMGLWEKILKIYDIEFFNAGGEAYTFKKIDGSPDDLKMNLIAEGK